MLAVRLQKHDFSVEEELLALRKSHLCMGGVASFLGCARDFSDGNSVQKIEFDAYGSMALKELIRLREEAIQQFGLMDVRIVHRIGVVHAGEQIVLIATGAEHRKPALHACEWLIDEIKQRVPIWKKEINATGEMWVSPRP